MHGPHTSPTLVSARSYAHCELRGRLVLCLRAILVARADPHMGRNCLFVFLLKDSAARREYDRVVLLGHSYGGFLAQEFALRHPERLSGLILCSTTPAFDYGDVVMGNASRRGEPEQVELLNEGFGAPVASDEPLANIARSVPARLRAHPHGRVPLV